MKYEKGQIIMGKVRLIINEDNSHYFCQDAQMAERGIKRFIEQYENTGVTDLFFNVNAMNASFDSEVFGTNWDIDENARYVEDQFKHMADCSKHLNSGGKSLYREWIELSRERNISPWISMRMNDVHGVENEDNALHSDFWRDHPEYRRVNYRFTDWPDKALDYGRKEVRDYAIAFIREIADRFNLDGLELDWMRFGFHFRPGFEQSGAAALNQLMRDVRAILNEAETKHGHAIKLAARVPASPESALGLGYDAATWAQEGLIDLLIVTPFFWTLDTDMPIEIWQRLLRGTKAKLAAGLEIQVTASPKDDPLLNSLETMRGAAWSYINRGVDAVYLFNFMHSGGEYDHLADSSCDIFFNKNDEYRKFLQEISDIDAMRGKSRRHVVTFSDTWAPGEAKGYLLPAALGNDKWWKEFRVNIGEPPVSTQDAYVVISINDGVRPNIWVNGVKCEESCFILETAPIPIGTQYSYKIPKDALHHGYSLVEAEGGAGELVWVEICIGT